MAGRSVLSAGPSTLSPVGSSSDGLRCVLATTASGTPPPGDLTSRLVAFMGSEDASRETEGTDKVNSVRSGSSILPVMPVKGRSPVFAAVAAEEGAREFLSQDFEATTSEPLSPSDSLRSGDGGIDNLVTPPPFSLEADTFYREGRQRFVSNSGGRSREDASGEADVVGREEEEEEEEEEEGEWEEEEEGGEEEEEEGEWEEEEEEKEEEEEDEGEEGQGASWTFERDVPTEGPLQLAKRIAALNLTPPQIRILTIEAATNDQSNHDNARRGEEATTEVDEGKGRDVEEEEEEEGEEEGEDEEELSDEWSDEDDPGFRRVRQQGIEELDFLSSEEDGSVYEEDDFYDSLDREAGVVEHRTISSENSEEEGVDVGDMEGETTEFETFELKVIYRRNRTGFEESKDFPIANNSVIAGRYQILEFLGSTTFSKAVQCYDLVVGRFCCIKIIQNDKDFFDQSLDEIKLLRYLNSNDPDDSKHILRLYDFFYFKEHLLIVCELLRDNLYEFSKYHRDSNTENYFTLLRLRCIARQILEALAFIHASGLIHCDLKPENILIKSYSRCEVKVIDFGCACFGTDHLSSYVQSRSYRAPEVILGLPYDAKIDIWSLGCILAELYTGTVLFQNDSVPTLLARLIGILGPIDRDLLRRGRFTSRYFTRGFMLYETDERGTVTCLHPKPSSLRHRLKTHDEGFVNFLSKLLTVRPSQRPTAAEALRLPWLAENDV